MPGSAADRAPHAAIWPDGIKEVTLFAMRKWEADMARLPARIVMRSNFSNIDGGYQLVQGLTPNMHPAYYNREDDTAIWWVTGKWVLSKGHDSIGAATWAQVGVSKKHAGLSPLSADWEGVAKYIKPYVEQSYDASQSFEDSEFVAEEQSLGDALAKEHPRES